LDNASTYPPLLKWYETCPCEVIRLSTNYGHRVLWNAPGVLDAVMKREGCYFYGLTDPDIDMETVPVDVLDKILEIYAIYGISLHKIGVSLEINDLPDNEVSTRVKEWEQLFWNGSERQGLIRTFEGKELPVGIYAAAIDTTFAIYRRDSMREPFKFGQVRLDRPYTAKHMPWYLTVGDLPEDYKVYASDPAIRISSNWCTVVDQYRKKVAGKT